MKTFYSLLTTKTNAMTNKTPLLGLSKEEVQSAFASIGVKEKQLRMRANQLWHWLYHRGTTDFADMTTMSLELRQKLHENFSIERPEIVSEQISVDGTRKWLMALNPLNEREKAPEVECVYIPESDRGTLCISSQIGCTLNCSFCHTGTQRLVRNLTAGEIIAQIMLAKDRIGDWPEQQADDNTGLPDSERKITNIVLMGMG